MKNLFFCALVLLVISILGISPLGFGQQPTPTTIVGGGGGSPFSDMEIPADARVLEVYVFSGDWVDALQMSYLLPDGRTVTSPRHGGPGGQRNVFHLDADEYIIGLSGRYGNYIDSLQIHTNKRTSPLFGGRGGSRDYRIDVAAGTQAVGFTGRAGNYLDAIGLTYLPLKVLIAGQTIMVGGNGGTAFSDRDIPLGARISEIRVHSGSFIDSIQAVYTLQDGRLFEGPMHGGGGGNLSVFRLDSDEYIVGISGRYGTYVDSLSVQTNKRTSQLFGGRGGSRDYRISVPSGTQAIAFAGRAGGYLDAVGLNYTAVDTTLQRERRNRFRILR